LPHKAERARLLMLALASLALRGGETAVWLDGHRRTTVQGRNGLERIAARMGDLTSSPASNLQPPAASLPLSRHAHLILCSDFLMPPERLESLMQGYASQNLKGALVHVLDPAENDFGFEGRVEMQGLEGEAPLKLPNAAALREAYTERLEAHKARLEFLARSAGWLYVRHVTSSSPHLVLMQLWQGLGAGI
jgi:uncharacterized protein (DUF58 family)